MIICKLHSKIVNINSMFSSQTEHLRNYNSVYLAGSTNKSALHLRPRKLYKYFSSVLLVNKYLYGKESMKSDYAFLCAENRGVIHAESPTPAHIPEINLKYKIV